MLILIIGIVYTGESQSRQEKKAYDRQFKQKTKEYKAGNWKIDGTANTLEVKLIEHYNKLKSNDYKELVGSVSNCKSLNVCQQAAFNNAVIKYANAAGSFVRGRVASDLNIDQASGEMKEFDKMYAAYERLVSKEIKGELQESYALVRENGGNKEYMIMYLVNENKASEMRMKAFENAAKETAFAQEYAKKISTFVKEGFEVENDVK
jgi:hypothetical protein